MEERNMDAGRVGILMAGSWNTSQSYEMLSCVSHNGKSWGAKKDVPAGVEPSEANSAFWQLMSDRGAQGIQGPVGPQGNSAFDGTGVEIVNNLTQGGEAAALSAEQGKILKTELTELESEVIGLVGIIPLIANTEHSSNNDRVNVAIKEGTTFLITSRVNSELRYTATISGFDKDGNATRLGDINKSGGKLEGVATMDITQIGVYASAGGNVSTSNMVLDIITDKTMLPRLSEVETEIIKIDTELTTLNNQINGGVNIQSFSADLGTSGMLTDIVVTAGEEYIFEGNKCVTIYVDGFSSPNVEIPFGTYTPVSFKPSNSGYIRIYPHETGNLLLTATLINKGLIEEIKEDKEMRYVVGDGGDFPTLTSAFQSLKDDASQKTLVIRGGTYDLFDELGGQDWLDSIPNDSTDWRQYSLFVPKNTKVIGEGNVTLNFLLPDSIPYSKAILLSALNISGSVEVANITINAKNCRYAIHDEDGTDINNSNSVKRYTNVRLNKGGIGYEQAYGAGFGKNSSIEVDSCIFKTDRYPAFSTHNNFRGDNSTIVLKSCAFINEGGTSNVALSFRTSDSRDSSNVKVLVSSCYIGGKLGLDDNPNTENATNVFEVTLINSGSPQVTNASGRNTLEPLILNS